MRNLNYYHIYYNSPNPPTPPRVSPSVCELQRTVIEPCLHKLALIRSDPRVLSFLFAFCLCVDGAPFSNQRQGVLEVPKHSLRAPVCLLLTPHGMRMEAEMRLASGCGVCGNENPANNYETFHCQSLCLYNMSVCMSVYVRAAIACIMCVHVYICESQCGHDFRPACTYCVFYSCVIESLWFTLLIACGSSCLYQLVGFVLTVLES